jgi:hypothetical protein
MGNLKRIIVLALAVCALLSATAIVTPVWITGDGTAHVLDATQVARSVTVLASPTNSTGSCSTSSVALCPVVGDANIAIGSRGIPLLPGSSYTFAVLPTNQPGYNLWQLYAAASAGDKVMVLWVK